jgi:hypothetical protein
VELWKWNDSLCGVLAMRIVADAEGDMLDKVSIYDEVGCWRVGLKAQGYEDGGVDVANWLFLLAELDRLRNETGKQNYQRG